MMTTIYQESLACSSERLSTLASYRYWNVIFVQKVSYQGSGAVSVGDQVDVLEGMVGTVA